MGDGGRRAANALWAAAGLFLLLAAAGIFALDGVVARWTATLPQAETLWSRGVTLLDTIALKDASNFLLGAVLLLAGGLLLVLRSSRPLGFCLLYVGAVQFFTTAVADLSKPWFGRLRPFEALANPGGADAWFVGANAFPSGHVAFYAGLFFPLIVLAPRWSLLWILPPLFVAAARVLEHDHYLSDVCVSLALAAAVAAALAFLAERRH